MVILSNCLSDCPDEGSLKVATFLASRIRAAEPGTRTVTYERKVSMTDVHLNPNKLLLDRKLIRLLRETGQQVLYLPFPTRPLPMAARIFLLSRLTGQKVTAVLPLTRKHSFLSRFLLKHSRGTVAVLSESAEGYYAQIVGRHRVVHLKTGVDTETFTPVSSGRAAELKQAWGLDPRKKILLHVGHMKSGRNLARLLEVDPDVQVLLAVSTFTASRREPELEARLRSRENIRILEGYIPRMWELYQLADAYLFPVTEEHNCIDVPLSCLEAAACGTPVVTTAWGEMACFRGKPGFFFLENPMEDLNEVLRRAFAHDGSGIREAVVDYDWDRGAARLTEAAE